MKLHKAAFVFPGQGSQYPGMGKDYYDKSPAVRKIFEQASDLTGMDMRKLCFQTSLEEMTKTEYAQPAIFTVSYAIYQLFMKEGLTPSFMAGHSLGEITALTAAGALPFTDAVRLVKARGKIMQKAAEQVDGVMAAIRNAEADAIKERCEIHSKRDNFVGLSNYNSSQQIVISGNRDAVLKVCEDVTKQNGQYKLLKVNTAFHSPLMKEAMEEFCSELLKYHFTAINCPVISNMTAKPYQTSAHIAEILSQQIISPVLWSNTIEYFITNDVDLVIELGPGMVLKNFIKKDQKPIKAFSFDQPEDLPELTELAAEYGGRVAEVEKRLRNYADKIKAAYKNSTELSGSEKNITPITLCLAAAVCVPNRNRDKKAFLDQFADPYKKIRKIQAVIEREQRRPDEMEIDAAFDMLILAFKTKRVYENERLHQMQMMLERQKEIVS